LDAFSFIHPVATTKIVIRVDLEPCPHIGGENQRDMDCCFVVFPATEGSSLVSKPFCVQQCLPVASPVTLWAMFHLGQFASHEGEITGPSDMSLKPYHRPRVAIEDFSLQSVQGHETREHVCCAAMNDLFNPSNRLWDDYKRQRAAVAHRTCLPLGRRPHSAVDLVSINCTAPINKLLHRSSLTTLGFSGQGIPHQAR
jgi:hypothetical protein